MEASGPARDFAIVAIGASAGGVDAMRTLFSQIPPDIPASIFAVLHVGAQSELPRILAQSSKLPARHATQNNKIEKGHLLIAPPDRHMLLEDGHVRLTHGPRVNWARPAIDPLFLSAAIAYGPSVVGVILSGNLNDGTIGLYEIKHHGGTAIVQDPSDAYAPDMPTSALQHVDVDHLVPLARLAAVLTKVCRQIQLSLSPTVGNLRGIRHE
jgi:two-component system, chemotaxis family, protein-glutamate methylesterase/glutaminase